MKAGAVAMLPTEVWGHVATLCRPRDLLELALVCRAFRPFFSVRAMVDLVHRSIIGDSDQEASAAVVAAVVRAAPVTQLGEALSYMSGPLGMDVVRMPSSKSSTDVTAAVLAALRLVACGACRGAFEAAVSVANPPGGTAELLRALMALGLDLVPEAYDVCALLAGRLRLARGAELSNVREAVKVVMPSCYAAPPPAWFPGGFIRDMPVHSWLSFMREAPRRPHVAASSSAPLSKRQGRKKEL